VLQTRMRAYIIVSEHPYATVTDAEGRFLLDQVPPGQYTLRLWHERLGTLESPIQLQADQQIFLTFVYESKEKRTSTIRDQPPVPNPYPPS
jgi:hypothetical protein